VFLLIVDGYRWCLLMNIHRISFKNAVKAVAFSPYRSRIAVIVDKLLQIWRTPGFKKEFFPFELIWTFADFNNKVTALKWCWTPSTYLPGRNARRRGYFL
jgi:periodic tryptophan protein 2